MPYRKIFDSTIPAIAHLQAPIVQVADILLPQIGEFGGPKRVVVPVGIDQDFCCVSA